MIASIEDVTLVPCLIARVILKFTEVALICSNEKLGSCLYSPADDKAVEEGTELGFCLILLFSSGNLYYHTHLNHHPHSPVETIAHLKMIQLCFAFSRHLNIVARTTCHTAKPTVLFSLSTELDGTSQSPMH